jgi:hypothetical protein
MTLQKKMETKGSDKDSEDEFPHRERKQKNFHKYGKILFRATCNRPAIYYLFIL